MGWLKTMRVIKYLALLAFLINCSQLTLARPDGATATTPSSTTIANNGSGGSSSASTTTTTTTARERSTKVSSERTKGKFFTSIYIMQEMRCWMDVESCLLRTPALWVITDHFPDHQTRAMMKNHSRKTVLM